jgi:tetratricopeptide (TPR) repeat protein
VAVDFLLQPHQPSIDSAPVLNRLVNMHFARKDTGRYYLHPVDREYALSRLAPGEVSDREADGPAFTRYGLLHRAAEYFEQARLPRASWKSIEDLAPQLAEFELRYAGQDYESAWDVLREISTDYLKRWGWSRLVVDFLERLLGKFDDSLINSNIFTEQGHNYLDLGRMEQAIRCYERALAIYREAMDRSGECIAIGGLGRAFGDLGQHERAIIYHEQVLRIAREVGARREEAVGLGSLGFSYAALGQFEGAIGYYEQALDIERELGDRDEAGISLANLGLAYAALGQFERAISHNEEALAIAREVGERRGEGIYLHNFGCACQALGQFEQAIRYHEQFLAIAREIGERRGEGYALFRLAEALNDEGRHDEATRRAVEAVRMGRETGDPKIASHGNSNLALARLCVGELPGARAAAEAARPHDVPRNNHNVLALLGLISLRQGDRAAAAKEFSAAISHADVMLERCAQNFNALDAKGLALAGLAVLEGGHRAADAIAAFRTARAITKAPGIVGRVRKMLNLLAPSDAANVLARVCEAAENPDEAQAPQESP